AAELRRNSKGPVLLMDLALDAGLVGFVMGSESRYSVLDVTNNLDRLEPEFWRGVATDVKGVHVIPAPAFGNASEIQYKQVEQAIRSARASYEWVVLDSGRLRMGNIGLLTDASDPLLVTADSI